eukprot:COSAG01_NODE_35570_length_530_cov_0.735499_2_plen_38_part_01
MTKLVWESGACLSACLRMRAWAAANCAAHHSPKDGMRA